jgi:hypothetical protein
MSVKQKLTLQNASKRRFEKVNFKIPVYFRNLEFSTVSSVQPAHIYEYLFLFPPAMTTFCAIHLALPGQSLRSEVLNGSKVPDKSLTQAPKAATTTGKHGIGKARQR